MSEHGKNPYIPGLARRVWRDPLLLVAFGFGTGLTPRAPGTFGTIPGIVLAWLIGLLAASSHVAPSIGIAAALIVLTPLGIWICGEASRRLGVHDYGGIVFDEVIGVLIPFLIMEITPLTLLWAFLWFRIFDILKPWPIGWLDRRVSGGLGIMADDLLAGIFALFAMMLTGMFFPDLMGAH